MRPTLNVISPELCARVVTEAKRILAETGIDIRGPGMRKRLLDHGLKTTADGTRVLFPPEIVDRAIATAPSRSRSMTVKASPTRSWAATTSTTCPARAA
mgnify:CR=1 FL=1